MRVTDIDCKVGIEQDQTVRKLLKDGNDVLNGLTARRCNLVHAGLGFVGEVLEFIAAVENKDVENMKEEAGDAEFYLVALHQNCTSVGIIPHTPAGNEEQLLKILRTSTEAIVDKTKKVTMYNRPVGDEYIKPFLHHSGVVIGCLAKICSEYGISREEYVKHNTEKLLTGANARYASGEYSDEQATERADKK